jgi:glycosyltransferase involved in cell wall biosynthesis
MKLLLVTDGIMPFVLGGMQKHSSYLAKYLTIEGVKVTLVHCVAHNQPLPSDEEVNKAIFGNSSEHQLHKIITLKFPKPGVLPGHYIRESYKYSQMVYEAVKSNINNYDFIYCQGFTGMELLKSKIKTTINAKIISNLHGYEMFQRATSIKMKMQHLLLRGTAKNVSLKSDFVYSFGGIIDDILINKIGIKKQQILHSPIGIDKSWLRPFNEKPISINTPIKFLFIGRNERRKGIPELHKAISLIPESHAEFHFIGDINETTQIKRNNVIYHGQINSENVIKGIMYDCDILILPSYSEGMPTVIMEAMACGLAIIGTNVGAVNKQIKNHYNGWIITSPSVKNIVNAIQKAIKTERNTLFSMKENSINIVKENFVWEKVIKNIIKQLKKLNS